MPQDKIVKSDEFNKISINEFQWLNEPKQWVMGNNKVKVTTDNETDFWQTTWYNFKHHSGHLFGINVKDDFTFVVKVEAEFSHLYDQAGLMMLIDDNHWIKTGIEYNDGQPMIGSVLTTGISDWATGEFIGDPKKFWLRLTKVGEVVCIKYSRDGKTWTLLRLCPFPKADSYLVGLMCCTPLRSGLNVVFSDIEITKPKGDILHDN